MPLNVDLLESSFKLVAPQAPLLAEKFYQRLFAEHPEVRALFARTDMDRQKRQLIAMLAAIVANLRNPGELVNAVEQLADRHVGYGVTRTQYPVVGEVLLKTLAEVAGPAWNDDLSRAWSEAYALIQGVILRRLDGRAAAAA